MNKFKLLIQMITIFLLVSLTLGVVGCNTTASPTITATPTVITTPTPTPTLTPTPAVTSTPTPSPTPTPTSIPSTPVVLTIVNGSQTKTFSLAQLQALKVTSGYGGQKTKTGNVTGPYSYKGILLTDLLNAVGGITQTNSVKVTASDNYSKTFTYAQVAQPTFNTYDLTGNQATAEISPVLFVVWEQDGKALDSSAGPIQLGIITSKNQVADSSNWIKMTVRIDIIAAQ
jgi:hypothetical protein